MATEYRVVIRYNTSKQRDRQIQADTLAKAIELANHADRKIQEKEGTAAWTGARAWVEKREVGRWTKMD